MSWLHHGDERLHYSDHSHRWIAPPGIDQSAWEAGVRAHIQEHLLTMGGPPTRNERRQPPRVPQQRNNRSPRLRPAVPPKGADACRR